MATVMVAAADPTLPPLSRRREAEQQWDLDETQGTPFSSARVVREARCRRRPAPALTASNRRGPPLTSLDEHVLATYSL
jgi:hypothetical protein